MSVCRIALWAFRDKEWPVEGADIEDLRYAMNCALDWRLEGLKTFPHDNDIKLGDFIKWARAIIRENDG